MDNLPLNNTDSVLDGTHENEVSKIIIITMQILVADLYIL